MSASRIASAYLGEPPPDLRGFPSYTLRRGSPVHRVHRSDRDPWWFSSDGRGRFDLVLRPGRGTCYLARTPAAGMLETFKGIRLLPEAEVERRRVFTARFERPLRLGNCCAAGAARFGVNSEVHSTADYGKTQRWAAAFADAGFDGVRYFIRSDPSSSLIGYALFGDAGEAKVGAWPRGESAHIAAATCTEVERWGLRVVPVPE